MRYTAIFETSTDGVTVTIVGRPGGRQCQAWGQDMATARLRIRDRLGQCLRNPAAVSSISIVEVMADPPQAPTAAPTAAPSGDLEGLLQAAALDLKKLEADSMVVAARKFVEALGGKVRVVADFDGRQFPLV